MRKVNTFFAAATWYDDDDSEVCFIRPYHQREAIKIPLANSRGYLTGFDQTASSYRITDPVRIAEIQRLNVSRRNKATEEMEREYENSMKTAHMKNLIWLRQQEELINSQIENKEIFRREAFHKRQLLRLGIPYDREQISFKLPTRNPIERAFEKKVLKKIESISYKIVRRRNIVDWQYY